ncbi:MAG: nucleotidyltransferase family protein [Rudaea sp.]|uniref:N-acetylmuramate alpha-1-phosphate uridylyltransferase MurU n=1 Tax=Rudaea sp. TaxID=2136325 RepID=UPI0039E42215
MERALVFAAGRGERMRPLTDATPKPLLEAGGKRLIEYHLEKLSRAGIREVVINTSHLAEQFPAALGDGTRWNLRIRYSCEGPVPLETGGGMRRALPWFGDEPFLAVSADIWCDYDYAQLAARGLPDRDAWAHLVMVPNPDFHPRGDFHLDGTRLAEDGPGERLTFANIGVYRAALLADQPDGAFKLLPMYQRAMRAGRLTGERYDGTWRNIGTPRQLMQLDAALAR